MKTLKKILCLVAVFTLSACSENDPIIFQDAFIYLTDANNLNASSVDSSANNVGTYYIILVAPAIGQDLQVTYDLIAGNGFKADVDYRQVASTASPITIPTGIYRLPIRIEWLAHELDATKDNTMQIVLRSCDNPIVGIGRPGPDQYGAKYTITKK